MSLNIFLPGVPYVQYLHRILQHPGKSSYSISISLFIFNTVASVNFTNLKHHFKKLYFSLFIQSFLCFNLYLNNYVKIF